MPVVARSNEPVENRLLAALPSDEYERLRPRLQPVSFSLGEVVYEFGGQLDYVFFPTTSIVSLLYTMENGTSAEMGLTGNDGVVGIALFMGGGTMPNRAVVQSAGGALRMKAKIEVVGSCRSNIPDSDTPPPSQLCPRDFFRPLPPQRLLYIAYVLYAPFDI